ncbi:MFS transporter [Gordonia sp. LSe1-13]|uniref:MFS transporter n=1 Tax=Gordonia sesuvii TaxID=3116777 RepID=A0ABU7MIV6_9ACTN|nr:MFS transporter [Gordonia sp. LSe1-13]
MTDLTHDDQAAQPPRQSMARVASAAFVGSVIEYYDFMIFATAATLVFGEVFFPALGTAEATVASLLTIGVAFMARPIGSIVFGHLGDRLGRKRSLVATLLLMGSATILVGLMPTPAQIGIAAPILLVVLRIAQGISAGGEWAGAALFSAEESPTKRRGFFSMFPSFGGGVGLIIAPGAFLLVNTFTTEEQFLEWGWRIPFLASAVLIAIGLWIRLRLEEPAAFKEVKKESTVAQVPVVEAFKYQWHHILLAALSVSGAFALLYIGLTYLIGYGTSEIGLSRDYVLVVATIGSAVEIVGVAITGWLSDRVGRRRIILWTSVLGLVWSIALASFVSVDSEPTFIIGVLGSTFLAGLFFGPVGAYLPELFRTRYRFTATALSYNLAGIVGGALPPVIAAWLITDSAAIGQVGIILGVVCLLSLASTYALADRSKRSLTEVDDDETFGGDGQPSAGQPVHETQDRDVDAADRVPSRLA